MKKAYRVFCLLLVLINCVQIDITAENLMQKNYANMSQQELDQNLILAVKSNHANTVQGLIQAGANIAQYIKHNSKCGEYDSESTLFEYAKNNGYEDIVKELIQARTNKNVSTAIIAASQAGDLDAVKELIRAGVNLRYAKNCCVALIVASEKGYLEIVKELIRGGVDVNCELHGIDSTALLVASRRGHLDIMRELIKAGAHVNAVDEFGTTCLIKVIDHFHSKNIDFVKLLLNAKCDVNHKDPRGQTALLVATMQNQPIVVKELMQAGADIDQKTNKWPFVTPLSLARDRDYREVLKELKKSKKTLIIASREGNLNFVKELVQEGFDVNIADDEGNTALMKALSQWCRDYYDTDEIIKILLNAKCNVNHANIYGNTALIEAVIWGRYKAVEILLKCPKINVDHVNKDGKTAFEIAIEKAPSKNLDYFDRNESLARAAIADRFKRISK